MDWDLFIEDYVNAYKEQIFHTMSHLQIIRLRAKLAIAILDSISINDDQINRSYFWDETTFLLNSKFIMCNVSIHILHRRSLVGTYA